ncbi:type II toxin-antitoxin system RelE/ParE family toxin [Candidatus Woesearchaeota archaeon]|nr:type II toxin-antitoxin system RelE/ParE family toxin [Candidatus Woesearchaeota archaeon]
MFSIEITQEAENDLKKLDKPTTKIIINKLWTIKENPHHYIERLQGLTFWKLRIGDYRAIIRTNTNEHKLIIVKIGHRKNIYKQMYR